MERSTLTYKRPVLDSTGTRVNSLYYNAYNSDVSALECTFGYDYKVSLSSKSFGSSSTIQIPIGQFISSIVLHLRVRQVAATEILCRSWALAIISSLSYTIGASNSTQIVLQSESLAQELLAQLTSSEARSEMMKLAGEYVSGYATPGAGSQDAYVLLSVPQINDFCGHLPIDSSLLLNNITLQIEFKSDPRSIYGGEETSHPDGFEIAEVIFRRGQLSNQAASIKQEMIRSPDKKYNIPFIHTQNFTSPSFAGSGPSSDQSIELTTFPNADLVGVLMWVIKDKNKYPIGATSPPNPFLLEELSDIVVTLGGSTLFNYPAKSYKLTNMLVKDQSASYFEYCRVNSTNPFPCDPVNCYPIYFDFGFFRSACMGAESLQNTFRIPNNQLRVQFKTPDTDNCRMYCTYFVNGVCELENGTSSIYIS